MEHSGGELEGLSHGVVQAYSTSEHLAGAPIKPLGKAVATPLSKLLSQSSLSGRD